MEFFSTIKNEYRFKEWILYYKKMGIEYFIIYDDYSENNIEDYFNELKIKNYYIYKHNNPILEKEKLNNISYARTDFIKEKLINICNKNNIDYLMMFDADEFLYLNKFNNLQQMIKYYEPLDILHINWLIFHKNIKKK